MTATDLRAAIHNVLESAPKGLHIDAITMALVNDSRTLFDEGEDSESLKKRVNTILANDVKKTDSGIMRVMNAKTRKPHKGMYKLRPQKSSPNPKGPKDSPVLNGHNALTYERPLTTTYIGKAGECAVMSELLYRGFNVNTLLVDEGVDVVASKNNEFYLVQVKTTILDNGDRVRTQIRKARFDAYRGYQIRYVVVVRCREFNRDTNIFFTFNNDFIEENMYNGFIRRPENEDEMISLKIRFKDNIPYLYHGDKEREISFHRNKFDW